MKPIYYFGFALFSVFASCGNKQNQTEAVVAPPLVFELSETALGNNFDQIDFNRIPHITEVMYDSLQLGKIGSLQGYDTAYLSLGSVLYKSDFGKVLTIQVITDGEITEYLLSYDLNNNLTDSLIVAYEDMVEGYSQVSSIVKPTEITIQTINFNYNDDTETADTTVANYKITPELRFERIE